MSIQTAMAALDAAPTQQQAISPKEVAAATVEQETNAKNDTKLASETAGVVDAPKVAEATEAKTPKADSAKFAALAKKETAIVKRDQELRAKEGTITEREAKLAAREAKIKQSESLWETDVLAAIKERTGMDYNAITEAYLSGQTGMPQETDPVKLAKKTIDDFKKEQADERAQREEQAKSAQVASEAKQKADLEAAWEAYNQEVNEYIDTNKDTYELISLYEQQKLIPETVDEFFKQNKRVLSVKEAADMVESYLEGEAKKAMSSKKLGGTKVASKENEEPRIQTTKTLNNNMQPTSASVLPAKSESDRIRRAMSALEGKR